MAIDTITQRLLDLDVFRGLASGQVERIVREAERIIFRDGQVMAKAGADADGALVLISGHAMALANSARDTPGQRIETGSMLAESAMLTEHQSGLTVVADGDVRAIKITREKMHAMMTEDPTLAQHFVSRIAGRLTRVAIELRLIDERLGAATAA